MDAANGIPICSVMKQARSSAAKSFAQVNLLVNDGPCVHNNWLSYLEQMSRGVEAIQDQDSEAIVYVAEHDMKYPRQYFDYLPESPREIIKNLAVFIINAKAYYLHRCLLHSQTILHVDLFRFCLDEQVPTAQKFKNLEQGGYSHKRVECEVPCLDFKWGGNYTGARQPRQEAISDLPGWGNHASQWGPVEALLPPKLVKAVNSKRWGGDHV